MQAMVDEEVKKAQKAIKDSTESLVKSRKNWEKRASKKVEDQELQKYRKKRKRSNRDVKKSRRRNR